MKAYFSVVILGLLVFGCKSNQQSGFWDISRFNINEKALSDNEEIRIIYASQGPDKNVRQEYYYHLVVVSLSSGDTVNLLTVNMHGISRDDGGKTFVFFSQDNVVSKLIQNTDKLENVKHVSDLDELPVKKINKVARDPRFDEIADNDYPAIIGSVGLNKYP